MQVEYRPIPFFPGYRVGSDGTVWTSKLGAHGGWRKLRTPARSTGYPRVTLSHANVQHDMNVHQIVVTAFHGPRPSPLHVCRHLDGDPRNNSADNLAWGTFRENEADKLRHGRRPVGERVHGSKLTADQVVEMRERFARGETIEHLAVAFGLARISAIKAIHGKTWSHVPTPNFSGRRNQGRPQLGERHHHARMGEAEVREIRRLHSTGLNTAEIGRELGIPRQRVAHVISGRTWSHVA